MRRPTPKLSIVVGLLAISATAACERGAKSRGLPVLTLEGIVESDTAVAEAGGLTRCRCQSDGTIVVLSGSPQRLVSWSHANGIRSVDGTRHSSIPVPTERARRLGDRDVTDPATDVTDGVVLRDAIADTIGRLHLLAPPDDDNGRHMVIVLDTDGIAVQAYVLDMSIGCLAIDETGSYVGVSDETGQIIRFQVQ